MKKLALAVITTAFIAIGYAPVSAQSAPDPEPTKTIPDSRLVECGEITGRTDTNGDGIAESCVEFYVAAGPPVVNQAPPVVNQAPPAVTTTTVVLATGPLPRTGSSVSPLLGLGGALLVGGGIIVVATRRRSTATAS